MKREVLNHLFPESPYKSIRAKGVAQIDNALWKWKHMFKIMFWEKSTVQICNGRHQQLPSDPTFSMRLPKFIDGFRPAQAILIRYIFQLQLIVAHTARATRSHRTPHRTHRPHILYPLLSPCSLHRIQHCHTARTHRAHPQHLCSHMLPHRSPLCTVYFRQGTCQTYCFSPFGFR